MSSIRAIPSLAVLLLLVLAPAGARAGDGSKLLRYLPEGTEMVAVVDVAGARKKPLVKDWATRLGDDWKQKLTAAGIDPLRDVDTFLLAAGLSGDDTLKLAIVEGRFAADAARRLGEGSREVKHGKVSYWVDEDSGAAMVGKRLVMAPAARMPAAIDLVSGRGAGGRLAKLAPLRAIIGAADTRHHFWVAMVMTGDLRQKVGEVGADAQGAIMAASAGRDLRLELRVLFVDEATAIARLDQLRVALPQATGAIAAFGFAAAASTLSSDREGSAVRVTATVSPTELTTLGEIMGGLTPAAPGP